MVDAAKPRLMRLVFFVSLECFPWKVAVCGKLVLRGIETHIATDEALVDAIHESHQLATLRGRDDVFLLPPLRDGQFWRTTEAAQISVGRFTRVLRSASAVLLTRMSLRSAI